MDQISQEKAHEYRQVAALVCQDLDCLLAACNICKNFDELKGQIAHVHKMKEELITNKEVREDRYNAFCSIWYAIMSGQVHCDKVG